MSSSTKVTSALTAFVMVLVSLALTSVSPASAAVDNTGQRDPSFTPLTLNSVVRSVAEVSGGKYLIGGNFTDAGGDAGTDKVARLGLEDALTPTLGSPTPTADGFTVQVTNFDSAFEWGGTATAGGSVTVSGTGLVTVTGVAPATLSTATITTTRTGYAAGTARVSATSSGAALTPQVPLRNCVVNSGALNRAGMKVVTRAGCRTNANRVVVTRVTPFARGDVRAPRLVCVLGAGRVVAAPRAPAGVFGQRFHYCGSGVMVVATPAGATATRYLTQWVALPTPTFKRYVKGYWL